MFLIMEQMTNGEFTGFISEAEDKEDALNQVSNWVTEKVSYLVINEETKEEFFFNENSTELERIT